MRKRDGLLVMTIAALCFLATGPKAGWLPWSAHWVLLPLEYAVGLGIVVWAWLRDRRRGRRRPWK